MPLLPALMSLATVATDRERRRPILSYEATQAVQTGAQDLRQSQLRIISYSHWTEFLIYV